MLFPVEDHLSHSLSFSHVQFFVWDWDFVVFPSTLSCLRLLPVLSSCLGNHVGETVSQQTPPFSAYCSLSAPSLQCSFRVRCGSCFQCDWDPQLHFDWLWFSIIVAICWKAKHKTPKEPKMIFIMYHLYGKQYFWYLWIFLFFGIILDFKKECPIAFMIFKQIFQKLKGSKFSSLTYFWSAFTEELIVTWKIRTFMRIHVHREVNWWFSVAVKDT